MSLLKIRHTSPLVHCITNNVVTNFTANGLLAIGASPVMSDEPEEVEDMVSLANALLINIGTLNKSTAKAMLLAGQKANSLSIPVVLDPVGVGATTYRKTITMTLLQQVHFQVIRCNVGELATIAGVEWKAKGVDSGEGEMDVAATAKQVALTYHCIVIVTGAHDYVTNGQLEYWIHGGNELMTQITGTGCLLSAICAAALTVKGEKIDILRHVLKDYKNVAEYAAKQSLLGAFQVEIMNGLHKISRGESK